MEGQGSRPDKPSFRLGFIVCSLFFALWSLVQAGPNWPWAFLFILPADLAILFGATGPLRGGQPARWRRLLDAAAALAPALGVVVLACTVVRLGSHPWGSPRTAGAVLGTAAGLLAWFVVRQTLIGRGSPLPAPLVRLLPSADIGFVRALAAAATYALLFLTSVYLQHLLHLGALVPLQMMAFFTLTALAALVPPFVQRLGLWFVLVTAMITFPAPLLIFPRSYHPGGPYDWTWLIASLACVALLAVLAAGVSPWSRLRGRTRPALMAVCRAVGCAVGLAVVSAAVADPVTAVASGRVPSPAEQQYHHALTLALAQGYRLGFLASLALIAATGLRGRVSAPGPGPGPDGASPEDRARGGSVI
jgi:hypothetical protein